MKRVRHLLTLPLVAALLLAVALSATPARAAGVVTNCTETGLANAMNAGSGLITFDCGPSPVVIVMTLQAGGLDVIPGNNDTIDGGDKVTLSGGNAQRLFDVQPNAALTLTHIILTDGYAATGGTQPTWGGAVLAEGKLLTLDHVTIRRSQSAFVGGAIRVVTGTVLIQDSLLENNQSGYGGGIDGFGTLTIVNSIVRGNHAQTNNGGGLSLGGTVVISGSQIYSNTAVAGSGGGLFLTAPSRVTITNSQITSNTALADNTYGGGIQNLGRLTLTNSSLSGNHAFAGGGLSNEAGGQAALDHVRVNANLGDSYSAGLNNEGVLTVTSSSLTGNRVPSSAEGGALGAGGNARTTLTSSLVAGNFAGSGAGLASAGGPLTLTNVTLSGNAATGNGGGFSGSYGAALLVNVTFSGNTAASGGAIYYSAPSNTDSLTLKNTLLTDSGAGGNCQVSNDSMAPITSAGFNLSSDNSCAADLNQVSDQNQQPALLRPLANNGGFTLTHLPQHGSQAIDRGTAAGCPPTDQRGQPRPAGGICDIGAVEVQPSDLSWVTFLAQVRR